MRISWETFLLFSLSAHWAASSAQCRRRDWPPLRTNSLVLPERLAWGGGGLSLAALIAAALAGWQCERGRMKAMMRWIFDTTRF